MVLFPERGTTYSLTKYVPDALIRLVAIVVFGIAPGLGGIIGAGKLAKAARVRGEIMLFTWLFATVAGATILLWNQNFVGLWVGATYDAGPLATLLIVIMVTQLTLIRNDANIIDLTLNVRRKVMLGVLSVSISLALAALLIDYFQSGILGMCLGFIAGRMILSLIYPWMVGRYLDISLARQFQSVLRPAATTIILFGLVLGLREMIVTNTLTATTWPGLVLSVGLTVVVLSGMVTFIGLSSNQRQQIWQRLQSVTGLASEG